MNTLREILSPIGVIALREWRTMFLSPLAWTLLAVLFAIDAYMFYANIVYFQAQQLQFQVYGGGGGSLSVTEHIITPVLGNTAVLLLLILPLLTMRLVADEKRRNTWAALASSPISPMQLLLGKYFGLLLFLLVAILLTGVLPLTLYFFSHPDTGQVLAGLAGLYLTAATFGAIGLAASSATENPIVAAIASFGLLLLLWIAAWTGQSGNTVPEQILVYLSLVTHYEKFLRGVITSTDLVYFLLISSLGLLFARQRLIAERIRG